MLSQNAFQKLQMANFSLRRVLRDSSLSVLKGELKAEISNFSNISEVNFVKLFSLVYCFLRENYVRSCIIPAFATLIWGRMGKRDFIIKRNTVNTSGAQQYTIMASRGNKRVLFYGAFSHVFPISYVISGKNDR